MNSNFDLHDLSQEHGYHVSRRISVFTLGNS